MKFLKQKVTYLSKDSTDWAYWSTADLQDPKYKPLRSWKAAKAQPHGAGTQQQQQQQDEQDEQQEEEQQNEQEEEQPRESGIESGSGTQQSDHTGRQQQSEDTSVQSLSAMQQGKRGRGRPPGLAVQSAQCLTPVKRVQGRPPKRTEIALFTRNGIKKTKRKVSLQQPSDADASQCQSEQKEQGFSFDDCVADLKSCRVYKKLQSLLQGFR